MVEKIKEFGEGYDVHVKRATQAKIDLKNAEWEDRVDFPHNRIYPGTQVSQAVFNIELQAMVATNPNTSDEEKTTTLAILKRLESEEINLRLKERKKRERESRKFFRKIFKKKLVE